MIMQTQQGQFWCWAAVAVSVDHYVDAGSSKTQCEVARSVVAANPGPAGQKTPQVACNNDPVSDMPETLQDALGDASGVGRLGSVLAGEALDFADIQAQVRLPSPALPVCVRIGWRGGGGHFVAIDGAVVSRGAQWVHVVDPAQTFQDAWWPYDIFRFNYQGIGQWTDTFLVKP